MNTIAELRAEVRTKLENITADNVAVDEARLKEIREAEIQRAQRIHDAWARGEPLSDEPPVDPEARAAIALTSSPGMVAPADEVAGDQPAEASAQAPAARPPTRRAHVE